MYRQDEPEVNLERLLERVRSFFGRFRIGGVGGSIFGIIVIVFVIALGIWLSTGVYTIQPGEQAAIRTFGAFDQHPAGSLMGGSDPGLHWWWPSPIGTVAKLQVEEVRRLELGFRGETPFPAESLMITGDEEPQIVDAQLLVQYNIKDIEQFLFRVADPDGSVLKSAAETSLRQVVGRLSIDDVLVNRGIVESDTKALLQKLLDQYETGINVTEVKLQSVLPPPQVQPAFDDVNVAIEEKQQTINLAQAYEADVLPKAIGDARRMIRTAEATRAAQINKASGEAERFVAILSEYVKAKDVTRQRLYLDAMNDILPGVNKFIVDPNINMVMVSGDGGVLPLPVQEPEG